MKYTMVLLLTFVSIWGCSPTNHESSKPVKIEKIESLLLPLSAIDSKNSIDISETYIYIFDPVEQVAIKKAVQIGEIKNSHVEVLSGLHGTEQVIVAGVPFLKDGQKVRRWSPTIG